MHQLFDPDSWIMGVLSEIADLMIVNVLWILTSIPIFTIGASTTALYAVVKTPGSKRYASSVVKNYFSAFRRNFRSATLTFLILLVPMALALCNIFLLLLGLLEGNLISYVSCGLSAFLFVFIWDYVFPLIACFENGIFRTIGNALILSIANLPVTLVVTALNLLPLAVLIFFTEFFFRSAILWLLLAFALIAKINCFFLERVFRRFIPADPEAAETEV